ncbi:MAG: twin-arginine translocase TatA/TatE family subunit, partial [Chloroflexota bacterium]|nr:twin-arginine translocase TatA/TatE family subunit [Chloroflexota bacterium]
MEHLPLLFGLLVLGLIIFGPKKMIEMGGRMGQMLRELRAAVKEMNWSVLGDDAPPRTPPTTLGKLSQLAQDFTAPPAATSPTPPAAVEPAPPATSPAADASPATTATDTP